MLTLSQWLCLCQIGAVLGFNVYILWSIYDMECDRQKWKRFNDDLRKAIKPPPGGKEE